MRTALRVLLARIRGRALSLEGPTGRFHLFPDGTVLPAIAGGDKTPEEIAAEEAERKAEEEREAAEAEQKQREEEGENEPEPILKGDLDKERAERLIRNERERADKRLRKAQEEADKAKAEADKLRQERESEHETAKREAAEAKAETERVRANADRIAIDVAVRDAAAEADVPAKKIKRLVRLVDRDDISVDSKGEVDGASEAVAAFLEDFPEFTGEAPNPGDPDPVPDPEPAGGNPNRREKPGKEITAEQARKLAKEDPGRFNELFEAGKIPQSALSGAKK